MKKSLIAFIIAIISLNLHAQSQKTISQDFSINMYDSYPDYSGTLTYSYTVSDYGGRIMNGPISVTGSIDGTYSVWASSISIKGNYKLSGSIKDNELNGPFSVVAKYHFTVKQGSKAGTYDEEAIMKGAFVNGLPNGNFTGKITDIGSVNVNYKNGYLVGPYSVDVIMLDNSLRTTIKGNFDNEGRMTGKWEFKGDGTMDFLNGVLLSDARTRSVYGELSDSQIEIAKQYANGIISDDELKEKGAIIEESSMPLGDYASDLFYRKRLVNWNYWRYKDLPICSFGQSLTVKFKYLVFARNASDSSLDPILQECKEKGYTNSITFDKRFDAYVIGYSNNRLSDEQLAEVHAALDIYNRQKPYESFTSYLSIQSNYTYEHQKFRNGRLLINLPKSFEQLKKSTDLSDAQKRYDNLISLLNCFDADLAKLEKTSDGKFYIIQMDGPFSYRYLPSASVEEFIDIEKSIRDYYEIMPENVVRMKAEKEARELEEQRLLEEWEANRLKEEEEAKRLKEEEEAKRLREEENARRIRVEAALKQKICPTLDRLVGKTINDFKVSSDAMYFKGSNGYDASLSDFKRSVKPFLPLVEYVIESVDVDNRPNYEIHFVSILSVQGKKQVKKYRLPMVATGNGEIFISSFDMKRAQEVE